MALDLHLSPGFKPTPARKSLPLEAVKSRNDSVTCEQETAAGQHAHLPYMANMHLSSHCKGTCQLACTIQKHSVQLRTHSGLAAWQCAAVLWRPKKGSYLGTHNMGAHVIWTCVAVPITVEAGFGLETAALHMPPSMPEPPTNTNIVRTITPNTLHAHATACARC